MVERAIWREITAGGFIWGCVCLAQGVGEGCVWKSSNILPLT